MSSSPPVGRLAPSPTGLLHAGHARSFLAAWWSARAAGGRILMRIEDLDRDRCRPEYADAALRDLEWLGLDWDGEPLVQSADLTPYREALDRLLEAGLAFPCTCSRRELEQVQSAPHGAGGELHYPGTCRGRYASLAEAERASGVPAGVRFRVEPGQVQVLDRLAGPVTFDPGREVGDFILLRRDGQIAYQLAVCVDDARQGVTEVVRGSDLLSSAARQQLVHRALGRSVPSWAHLPLVTAPGGERLAKRAGGSTLAALREAGTDPRMVVAWCARSLGLPVEPQERLRAAELVRGFTFEAVPTDPVVWGEASEGA